LVYKSDLKSVDVKFLCFEFKYYNFVCTNRYQFTVI
jgi:hypothetical protein